MNYDDPFADHPSEPLDPETSSSFSPTTAAEICCPACGVGLAGATIGQPCPSCGVRIGGQRGMHTQAPSSGKATASMVLGIISIAACLVNGLPSIVCGILAIIFARQAREQIAAGQATTASLPQATAGRVCGIIGLSLGIAQCVFLIAYLIFIFWIVQQTTQNNPAFNPQPTPQPTPWTQSAPANPTSQPSSP